jgi:hypothetical protein
MFLAAPLNLMDKTKDTLSVLHGTVALIYAIKQDLTHTGTLVRSILKQQLAVKSKHG